MEKKIQEIIQYLENNLSNVGKIYYPKLVILYSYLAMNIGLIVFNLFMMQDLAKATQLMTLYAICSHFVLWIMLHYIYNFTFKQTKTILTIRHLLDGGMHLSISILAFVFLSLINLVIFMSLSKYFIAISIFLIFVTIDIIISIKLQNYLKYKGRINEI